MIAVSPSQAKHLQFVSGVDVTSYWLATFAWDMLNAMVPVLLTFILFAAFQVDGYKDEGLGAILLILVINQTIILTYGCKSCNYYMFYSLHRF